MKNLSKEKRNQLILVALGTVGVIAGLWFGVIAMQGNTIRAIAGKSHSTQEQIDKVLKVVAESKTVEAQLKTSREKLAEIESAMAPASGDLYSWMVSAVKQFNVPSYRVDMPQFSTPSVGPVTMLADFPYQQASINVSGTAYYDDFGKFIADFENRFPYMRVQAISLEPVGSTPGATAEEREKLSFHMEISALVKASNTL